ASSRARSTTVLVSGCAIRALPSRRAAAGSAGAGPSGRRGRRRAARPQARRSARPAPQSARRRSSSACSCCSSSVLLVVGVGKPGSVVALSVLAASVIVALVPGVSLDLCQPAVELCEGHVALHNSERRFTPPLAPRLAHLLRRQCVLAHDVSSVDLVSHNSSSSCEKQ